MKKDPTSLKTTPSEEWNYIWITLKELIQIIFSHWSKKIRQKISQGKTFS